MLGKLIKNEFIQRGKQTLLIFGGVILLSALAALLLWMNNRVITNNMFFSNMVGIYLILYVFTMSGSVAGLLFLTIGDFAKRLFKDQGYLTHTLPVKSSSIIFSRMVFDVLLIIASAIVYPFAICIATRDFSVFQHTTDWIFAALRDLGLPFERAKLVLTILLLCGLIILYALYVIWTFNAAYALGHSFGKNKRIWTVILYLIIAFATQMVMFLASIFIDKLHVSEKWFPDNLTGINHALMLIIILFFLNVVIMAVLTNVACKRKLNLE